MTINDLWALCETQRKKGFGSVAVRIYKRDREPGGVSWGPFGIGAMYVDSQTGDVTLEATEVCPHCRRP